MTKNKEQAKPAAARDSLVKGTKKGGIALTEQDLDKISGGVRKAGKDQQE